MPITSASAQLRTTNLAESIRFYTTQLGLTLDFQYEDFYAGIRAGANFIHFKLVDEPDPSIAFVDQGEHFHLYLETDDATATAAAIQSRGVPLIEDVHDTPWGLPGTHDSRLPTPRPHAREDGSHLDKIGP